MEVQSRRWGRADELGGGGEVILGQAALGSAVECSSCLVGGIRTRSDGRLKLDRRTVRLGRSRREGRRAARRHLDETAEATDLLALSPVRELENRHTRRQSLNEISEQANVVREVASRF
jgi:hypothetical protein